MLRDALAYADGGWNVLPLRPNDKRPHGALVPHGCKDASRDPAVIRDWWERSPISNVGIATGPASGVFVLDVDVKNGRDGESSLGALQDEIGDLPKTREAATPSGGRHIYFAHPRVELRNSAGKLGDGLDVRAGGGYVAAPSSVVDLGRYRWAREGRLARAPEGLLAKLQSAGPTASVSAAVPEGTRNDTLFREACRLRALNLPEPEALERLLSFNGTLCSPPLDEAEVNRCLASAWRYPAGYQRSDTGNARRFVQLFGQNVRYVIETGAFHVWDDKRWAEDARDLRIEQLMKQSNQKIWEEAPRLTDPDQQKRHAAYAVQSQNTARLRAAVESVKSEPGVAVNVAAFDSDPWLLGVANGVVDLKSGQFRESRRDDLITRGASASFEAGAACPTFERFIGRVLGGDTALVAYVQRLVGYTLTGDTSEHLLIFLYGFGQNGKSVLLETVKDLLGGYGRGLRTEALMAHAWTSKGGASEDEARLIGARFVSANETADGMRFNEPLIKDLTGGDTITARRLYENSVEFRPQFKLWIRGNHKPTFNGDDGGMARRIKLIPFTVRIPDGERDTQLAAKLRAELPGILNWAIAGCLAWQRDGMREPATVSAATREYLSEMDTLGEFIGDRCQVDSKAEATSTALYCAYKGWCEDGGYRALNIKRFVQKLEERGVRKVRTNSWRGFKGLRLRSERGVPVVGDASDTSDATSEKSAISSLHRKTFEKRVRRVTRVTTGRKKP